MRVALGTTVLRKAEQTGHLDGIAVYTQNLLKQIPALGISSTRYAFLPEQGDPACTSLGRFSYQAVASAVTGCPLFRSTHVEQNADLFHATDHYIPKLANVPVVATIMDPISLAHPEWVAGRGRWLKNALFKKTAHWADHIITISDYAADAIQEHFAVPASRISVTPLGVDENCFKRVSEEQKLAVLSRYNLPSNYFVFIGTLQPRKNIERLLDAFLQLPEQLQQQHPLVIVGREGWSSEALVQRLRGLALSHKVYWLDYVPFEDKYALLQASLAMVFPSLYEGFGLPVLEAFASNTPVISSNLTSLPEVAADAAILINPYVVDDIAQAMETVAQDEALRQDLQQKGAERVKQFSWEMTAQKTMQIYKTLV